MYYGELWVTISQHMYICPILLSESLLYEFLNLSTGGHRPRFCQPSASTWSQWMKNGSCILPGSVSQGRDILSKGKWAKHYDWPASLKCRSWLAAAQPQENVGCWQIPPPPDTHMHRHENDHFINDHYYHSNFCCHDFIMSTIVYLSVINNAQCVIIGSFAYPLFNPESGHSGSASRDEWLSIPRQFAWVYFPHRFPHYAWTA